MDRRTRVRRPRAVLAGLMIAAFGLGASPARAQADPFQDDLAKRCDLSVDFKAVSQTSGGYVSLMTQVTCGIAAPQAHIAFQKVFVSQGRPGSEGTVWRGTLAEMGHDPLEHLADQAMHEAACHTAPCWETAWPPDGMAAGIPCGGGTLPSGVHVAETFKGVVVDACSGTWNVLVLAGLASPYAVKEPTDSGIGPVSTVKAPGNSWTVLENGVLSAYLGHGRTIINRPGTQCTQQSLHQATGPQNLMGRVNQTLGNPVAGPRDFAAYDLPTTTLCYAQFGFAWGA